MRIARYAGLICLTLAPGPWTAAFAASLIDGNAIAVEHWEDEVPPPRGAISGSTSSFCSRKSVKVKLAYWSHSF
jgi:hypothetical protein